MKLRIITAIIGLCVLLPIVFFSHTVIFPIAVAIFASMGVFEMLGCIGVRKKLEITVPSIVFCFAICISTRYVIANTSSTTVLFTLISALCFVYLFYLLVGAVVSKGTRSISDMALTWLTTLYVTVGFDSILILRDIEFGHILFMLVFLGPWITDAAAYFCGRFFGKHKLIPDVSPKKTVEGAIGGSIFCAISFVVFGAIVGAMGIGQPNYVALVVTGLVLSVISQFGDLIASLIKRQYGIKDYGNLFPGHGGVMDRFDSIIAIAPFLLMFCSLSSVFPLFNI